MEGQGSRQHLPSLFSPFISTFFISLSTHKPSHPAQTTCPHTSSPERHGEPHTHHHQSNTSIFWTKTGEKIPPNLGGREQSQTVAASSSFSIYRSLFSALSPPFSSCITPTPRLKPHFLLHLSHSLLSLHHPPLPALPGSRPGPPIADTRSLCLIGSQSTHLLDELS